VKFLKGKRSFYIGMFSILFLNISFEATRLCAREA
jgi:hypothetical protein